MHSTINLNDGYKGSGKLLIRSINKYGIDAHITEIISYYQDRESLKQAEKLIINETLLANPLCMNLKIGGEGGGVKGQLKSNETIQRMKNSRRVLIESGWKPTRDSIKRASAKLTGRKHTNETKEKMSNIRKGKKLKPFTDEHRSKLSIARQARITTDETKFKISQSLTNNPKNSGWKLTNESREKQKQAARDALTNVPKEKVKCPHCGNIGGKPAMTRFHFDNCKHKIERS